MPHRTSRLLALAAGLLLAGSATARAGAAIELVGQLPITPPQPGGFVTNVWGWVHPTTQREYAIVGTTPWGIHIVDVTDPSNPVLTRFINEVYGFDMKTRGNYLYVCDGGYGVDTRILDISDPANPLLLPALLPTSHSIAISDGGQMYLNYPGLRALDLAQSATAPQVWFNGPAGGHDTTCRGNRVFDFAGSAGVCRIYEYSSFHTLTQVGAASSPGIQYYHSGDQSADGTHLFLCDELAVNPAPDISIFDIDPVATPQLVGSLSDPTATAHNLYVVGDVAYVSYYTAGFKAYNVANPAQPSLIGVYDTTTETGECYCGGAYGVYPFSPSGNVFVSDWDNGLFIFRLTTTTPVRFTGVSATARDGGVRIAWSLWTDESIDGFRVYRREAGGERDLSLTPSLLPAAARAFIDAGARAGASYSYVVAAHTTDGDEEVSVRASVAVPAIETRLVSVHPNPFHPAATVEFDLSRAGHVRLEVYDAGGARVRTLYDGDAAAGRHAEVWDGRDDGGRAVASGVYFARLTADRATLSRRMVLLK